MAARNSSPEIDERRALKLILELLAFPGRSGHETEIMKYITKRLKAAGAPGSAIVHDNAHKKSPLGGDVGNLIFTMPGTIDAPRRMLSAHVDTVPLCAGADPVKRGAFIVSKNKATGLGGDNRSGAAAILNAALTILEKKLPHPPLTFFWPVQEEVGLYGARYVDTKKLGGPKLCFNWDGNAPEKVIIGATGAYRINVVIHGLASHAGVAPEKGVSTIAIASLAIAELVKGGWHGLIKKGGKVGTSNVGVIQSGDATNVVSDKAILRVEARSHDAKFRKQIMEQYRKAFINAAKTVKSADGKRGSVEFKADLHYESFKLPANDASVTAAQAAVRSLGLQPTLAVANGGLDANWLTQNGLPAVTLGAGQQEVHTVKERLQLDYFYKGCNIALRLALGT